MRQPEPGTARQPRDDEVLSTLAACAQLPARVRMLAEGMLGIVAAVVERVLGQALTDFEQQLFKQADQARSSGEQQLAFEALREVKRGRADVASRCLQHLESSLAKLDIAPEPAASAAHAPRRPLELVDSRDLEESIALQEIAVRTEIRHSQALYALGHRFGVLAGAPVVDVEALPLGPHNFGAALRYAAACLDLGTDFRVALYRQFERHVSAELGALYAALNDYLIENRILRYLPSLTLKPRIGGEAQSPARERGATAAEPSANAAAKRTLVASDTEPLPSTAMASPTASPIDSRDSELFATLRELLTGRRAATGAPVAPATKTGANYVATPDDLQAVLGALQTRPATPMMLGGRLVPRSVGHVKQDLLAQLRQLTPDGKPARLAEEDSDTIDLVGMLFDYVLKDTRPSGATQALLTKLQVPVLRAALNDKTFFSRRNHPARLLLNAIAETGTHWIDDGDGDADRGLIEKMQLVVDRATGEFEGSPGLFEELLSDLSRHMATLARKAEMAERRHVDAAKGRERLDLARDRAIVAISERLAKGKPGRFVRTLLEQAWTDVLALTLLRQGEDSDAWRRRLQVADQLILGGEPTPPIRAELEQGLGQLGFVGEEIELTLRQLDSSAPACDTDAGTRTEAALKLKTMTRLGDDGSETAAARERRTPAPAALNTQERQMLERLRTLPFGTWFEFVVNQQGETVRRKLSWFSPLTGRCLFVNQRGARADERTLEQLARALVGGQARIAPVEKESLIDRAWSALVGTLRQFSGRGPAPAPAN